MIRLTDIIGRTSYDSFLGICIREKAGAGLGGKEWFDVTVRCGAVQCGRWVTKMGAGDAITADMRSRAERRFGSSRAVERLTLADSRRTSKLTLVS